MNVRAKSRLTPPLALALAVSMAIAPAAFTPAATAQSYGSTQAQSAFTQQDLDQMLAPIALYPDSLLSQVLMASTYPLEVVQAARWSRANPHLKGDDAVRAVESRDWDPSVKSLVAFPQILDMMDQKLDWTERLGEAFLAQQSQVMDSVQQLRQRAHAAGNLRSDDRIRVITQDRLFVVEPAQPQVVYVPYYNPTVVYGPWWWPGYPPVYWAPWPGYYARPGFSANFFWGSGITLSAGFFFGGFDWHRRHARVVHVHNHYYQRHHDVTRIRTVNAAPGQWRHDPDHRRGVPYRAASLRQEFGRTDASPDGRRDSRGRDSTTINSTQDDRRDGRGPARVETNQDTRRDARERNDNRSDGRDSRGPASRTEINANARPDAQQRNDNRPDARGPSSRTDTTAIVRPDGRENADNRPDLRDARGPGIRSESDGNIRSGGRGQETNAKPEVRDARGSAPRTENNPERRPNVRNDNRSDAGDARSLGVRSEANAFARPDVPKQPDIRSDARGSPANRPDARIAPQPEPRLGAGSRAEIRDSRPNIETRAGGSVAVPVAPAADKSAVIRSNPASQAVAEQRNRPEPRVAESASRAQSSGQGSGRRSSETFHEAGKREQQKK